VLEIRVRVIIVTMNVIISASNYEGNENGIAAKAMAIQRMTPAASAQLFPFVRWRRYNSHTKQRRLSEAL
jgi:hypothetical protein